MIVVAAFYKFSHLDDCPNLRTKLVQLMDGNSIKGTIIVAEEGINATVAGDRAAVDNLKKFLEADGRFVGLEYKESFADANPFKLRKVLIKREIVTMKQPDADPRKSVGTYVDSSRWNELLADPDVMVIDVRNDFEVAMGSFENAKNPKTKFFSDFPAYVKNNLSPAIHKKIAMSCTGGIRCEKASAYMKQQGFSEVYHLKGGVLQYLKDMPKDQSKWIGSCFVFDERIAVDHDLNALNHEGEDAKR